MFEDPCAEARVDLATGKQHQPLPHIGKERVKAREKHENRDHDPERVPSLMRDHLVDQHLQKQRNGKGDEVRHNCRGRDPEQQVPLLQQLRHEPAEPEGAGLVGQGRRAPGKQERARPLGLELFAGDQMNPFRLAPRVEDRGRKLAVRAGNRMHQDDPVAAAHRGKRRIGRAEPRGPLPPRPREDPRAKPRLAEGGAHGGRHLVLDDDGQRVGRQMDAVVRGEQEGATQGRQLRRQRRELRGEGRDRDRHGPDLSPVGVSRW